MPEERLQKILSQVGVASRRQAERIILGGQVSDERGDAKARLQQGERALEQRGLAGAGAGNDADHVHTGVAKSLAQGTRDQVILPEHVFPDFH